MSKQLWLKVGEAGDYESFETLDNSLVDYLNALHVGTVTGWRDTGFTTPNYHGCDHIRLFWGDAPDNPIHTLNAAERAAIECCLEEAYI